ncbi:rCG35683 [Rattus norvegicus]|nr:rCG35683 [Rattus norvegicus]
MILSSAF